MVMLSSTVMRIEVEPLGTLTSPSFDCFALNQVVWTFNEWFTGSYGGQQNKNITSKKP